MVSKIKRAILRVPEPVRKQAVHVAETFAVAFAGAFAVLAPGIAEASNFGTARDLIVSAIVASFAAGIRAARPAVVAGLKSVLGS